jgi:5-methyltetrahydropteroyltriglutamate--homocysteine methyltransferase
VGIIVIFSSDIGSLPAKKELKHIWLGADKANSLLPLLNIRNDEYQIFKEEVVSSFIDKLKANVDIPNYPQFRDMNQMFFRLMTGIEQTNTGLLAVKNIKAKYSFAIPETEVLKKESKRIKDESGVDYVLIKACITGPYTLASFFQVKTPSLFSELGHALSEIISNSLFKNKHAKIAHISIDEPTLGFMNDPLLDYGTDGRESLKKAWSEICNKANSQGVETSMHLHNTSENLFWEVENLNILASHVEDPLYSQEVTKEKLEETDKQLWAAISITQFDNLINNYYEAQNYEGNIPEKIASIWTDIRNGNIDPHKFLEKPALIKKRLKKIIDYFGSNRISISSPECGLNSFPNYNIAIECLKRTSAVIRECNKSLNP